MNFNLSNLSIASIKNSIDEVRAQVYPRNETERKVGRNLINPNSFKDIILFCTESSVGYL
jgi:hypothetical protein